jgi:hypothetical protein
MFEAIPIRTAGHAGRSGRLGSIEESAEIMSWLIAHARDGQRDDFKSTYPREGSLTFEKVTKYLTRSKCRAQEFSLGVQTKAGARGQGARHVVGSSIALDGP